MNDIDEDLQQLEKIAGALIAKLDARERSRLLRRIAQAVRASQAKRIRAQAGPDGEPWPPRKKRKRAERANRPIRFLYRKPGSDEPRVADLRSWRKDGPYIIGFDRERHDIRTFLRGRIERHLPPQGEADPGEMAGDLRTPKNRLRKTSTRMFEKLRNARNLKAGAGDREAWVEFTSRASRIARIHQFGLKDKVSPNGPEVRYPQRQLLGLSIEDREAVLSMVLDHVAA